MEAHNEGGIQEVKLFFEEIPAISDEEDDGPVITCQSTRTRTSRAEKASRGN
jgi:hypothetical protein